MDLALPDGWHRGDARARYLLMRHCRPLALVEPDGDGWRWITHSSIQPWGVAASLDGALAEACKAVGQGLTSGDPGRVALLLARWAGRAAE